jgi:hypothetical protein
MRGQERSLGTRFVRLRLKLCLNKRPSDTFVHDKGTGCAQEMSEVTAWEEISATFITSERLKTRI